MLPSFRKSHSQFGRNALKKLLQAQGGASQYWSASEISVTLKGARRTLAVVDQMRFLDPSNHLAMAKFRMGSESAFFGNPNFMEI
jgi:hypothetical protein